MPTPRRSPQRKQRLMSHYFSPKHGTKVRSPMTPRSLESGVPGSPVPHTPRNAPKGRGRGMANFVMRHRVFAAFLALTCMASLFVSFYVDIKILNMFDDPALAMTTTMRFTPAKRVKHEGSFTPAQLQKLREMLNISGKPRIVVEGDFDSHSGIAIANNNMKASLADTDDGTTEADLPFNISYEQLNYVAITDVPPRPDTLVTIRSGTWLPLMIPGLIPSKGWFTKGLFLKNDDSLLVYQLPWEFTVIPSRWVKAISTCVDRVWVPSEFVRDAYVDSGLPNEIIDVVPHAINDSMWSPQNKPYAFPTKKKFTFLFVSGMLHRKGIDVLLEAFTKAFTSEDDVSLYLHSSYSGESKDGVRMKLQILADIDSHLKQEGAPEIVLDADKKLSEEDYFGLYTGADAYILPFRGEGFALTIFEAALSGLPIITTKASPITDFLTDDMAYLVPATLEDCKLWPCSPKGMFLDYNGGSTAKPPQWWLPNIDDLIATMRDVVKNPTAARKKAEFARREMLSSLGLAGRKTPYIDAVNSLVAHRAKPNFVPQRKKNPICTSSIDYEFIEDSMDKEDKAKYDRLASLYESTGLGADVKAWLASLYDSHPTEEMMKKWHDAQNPDLPGAKGATIGLCTFPNSGTSWTLNLLKGATGVLKHTLYNKECNQNYRGIFCQESRIGFAINETGDEPGRMPLPWDPILVKTHMAKYGLRNKQLPNAKLFASKLKDFDRVVRLVRHPLDNFIARVNLEINNNRCGENVDIFQCLGADFFKQDMERYFAWHRAMDDACRDLGLPIITVVYEHLLQDTAPNLEQLLRFMGITPPEEQVRHATERWKPIHKPNPDGLPGYLMKYEEQLMKNISVVFHKLLHRDFKTTSREVGAFLEPGGDTASTDPKFDFKSHNGKAGKGGSKVFSRAKALHDKSIAHKPKAPPVIQRTYGVTENYKNTLAQTLAEAKKIVARKVNQGDEIVSATCTNEAALLAADEAGTKPGGVLPQLLFVGGSRSGIRSLYDILRHHRDFIPAHCRDTQFFTNMNLYHKGPKMYMRFYPKDADGKASDENVLTVDMSTTYFEKPNLPKRVLHIDPDMGIGVVLRNPSHHFVSKWLQRVESKSKDIAEFVKTHGKPFDCMNVFEQQKSETEKCFDESAGGAPYTDLEAARACVLSVKNDVSAGLYAYPLSMWTEYLPNPNQYVLNDMSSSSLLAHPSDSTRFPFVAGS